MTSRPLLLALVALLLAPVALAHIQGARPVLQPSERERLIGLDPQGLSLGVELTLPGDPLRQYVAHHLDPPRGIYRVEHRPDGSRPDERFYAEWRLERLIEFRDLNVDGIYQPDTDAAVKTWRFSHYQWNRSPLQRAQVADVTANDVIWEGNLTGAPHVRAEVVIAGRAFTDEGATVRPQDIAVYLDFTQMPPRGVGSLYALDATITVPAHGSFALHEAQNTTTALLGEGPRRRALLVWGGEGVLDGAEQVLEATIEDERVDDHGNRTARFTLHIPTLDRSLRLILVSGIEYLGEDRRSPMPSPLVLLAAVAVVAALGRRAR